MLAGFKHQHGILEVMTMRSGHIDNFNIGIIDEISVRTVCLGGGRGVDLLDEVLGPGFGAG